MEELSPVTLTAKKAAEYLGISYWLILEMAKQNKIPHILCGSRKLFRKEALDKWMDEKEKLSVKAVDNVDNLHSNYGKLRKVY